MGSGIPRQIPFRYTWGSSCIVRRKGWNRGRLCQYRKYAFYHSFSALVQFQITSEHKQINQNKGSFSKNREGLYQNEGRGFQNNESVPRSGGRSYLNNKKQASQQDWRIVRAGRPVFHLLFIPKHDTKLTITLNVCKTTKGSFKRIYTVIISTFPCDTRQIVAVCKCIIPDTRHAIWYRDTR